MTDVQKEGELELEVSVWEIITRVGMAMLKK